MNIPDLEKAHETAGFEGNRSLIGTRMESKVGRRQPPVFGSFPV